MYKSYCLTIRPRDGISDKTLDRCKKWLQNLEFAVGVVEKDDQARHLHAQIWHEPKRRADIAKAVQRICESTVENWDHAQLKVLRSGVRIAYSDWYLDYLIDNQDKENETSSILVNNPPDSTQDYYPSEEEQAEVMAMANSADPRFQSLEIQYRAWQTGEPDTPATEKTVARFLANQMFVERRMKVIVNKRDRVQLTQSLLAYLNKSTDIYNFLAIPPDIVKFNKTVELLNSGALECEE